MADRVMKPRTVYRHLSNLEVSVSSMADRVMKQLAKARMQVIDQFQCPQWRTV